MELRKDPIVDRWVVFSTERVSRPFGFIPDSHDYDSHSFCPFCEGNETSTPPETLCFGRKEGAPANGAGWSLRVVPNKFPALSMGGALKRVKEGMYDAMSGIGASEVVIETPTHDLTLANMSVPQAAQLFSAVKERFVFFQKSPELKCAQFFKNHGYMAGASLPHSHSQIIAMPLVSKLLGEEMDGAEKYFKDKGRCVYCDIIADESGSGERLVYLNSKFLVTTPYASRFPYETWILPTFHSSQFEQTHPNSILMLADAVTQTLKRMTVTLGDVPYNMVLHTSPFHSNQKGYYHWHLEIFPIQGKEAGFERGSGFHINSTAPEQAAVLLREAI